MKEAFESIFCSAHCDFVCFEHRVETVDAMRGFKGWINVESNSKHKSAWKGENAWMAFKKMKLGFSRMTFPWRAEIPHPVEAVPVGTIMLHPSGRTSMLQPSGAS